MLTKPQTSPDEGLRSRLLDVAAELFSEQGYGVSMRKIAKRAGCTATAIYGHFENKDALVFAIVEDAFVRFRDALVAAKRRVSGHHAQLREMAEAYLRFAQEHPHHYTLMFVQRTQFLVEPLPGVCIDEQRPDEPRVRAFDVLLDVVADGLHIPRSHPRAREVADAVWAAVHGLALLHLAMPEAFDPARVHAALQILDEMTVATFPEREGDDAPPSARR
ncbi:MAG: TetR/AcrR family transcriptional regulator [Myxococcota bacterium]